MVALRQSGPDATIRSVAEKRPELALIAGVVQTALADACQGDEASSKWLASARCLAYLSFLSTGDVTAEALQRALVDRVPKWNRPRIVTRKASAICLPTKEINE